MEPDGLNIAQEEVLVKVYSSLPVLENAISIMNSNDALDAPLPVVGNMEGLSGRANNWGAMGIDKSLLVQKQLLVFWSVRVLGVCTSPDLL